MFWCLFYLFDEWVPVWRSFLRWWLHHPALVQDIRVCLIHHQIWDQVLRRWKMLELGWSIRTTETWWWQEHFWAWPFYEISKKTSRNLENKKWIVSERIQQVTNVKMLLNFVHRALEKGKLDLGIPQISKICFLFWNCYAKTGLQKIFGRFETVFSQTLWLESQISHFKENINVLDILLMFCAFFGRFWQSLSCMIDAILM